MWPISRFWYFDSVAQVAVAAVDITLCYLNPKQSEKFAISFVAFRFHKTGFMEFLLGLALLFHFYMSNFAQVFESGGHVVFFPGTQSSQLFVAVHW